jgi:Ca2+-binding EF-hand superfamily protein
MSETIRMLLSDDQALLEASKPAFQALDNDGSGYIDEKELFNAMTSMANEAGISVPTLEQLQQAMQAIDRNRDGKVSLDEFLELMRQTLRDMLKALGEEEVQPDTKKAEEQINKQLQMFEKYLEESGITMAFQLIFAEILTKKIEAANVFTYTAMRLRQIGKEIAHLLPKNLTANIAEHA